MYFGSQFVKFRSMVNSYYYLLAFGYIELCKNGYKGNSLPLGSLGSKPWREARASIFGFRAYSLDLTLSNKV